MADLKVIIGDVVVLVVRLPVVLDFSKKVSGWVPASQVPTEAPAQVERKKRAPRAAKVAPTAPPEPARKRAKRVDVKAALADPTTRKKLVEGAAKAVSSVDRGSEPYQVSAPRKPKVKPLTAMPCASVQEGKVYFLEDGRPIVITGVFPKIQYVGFKHKGDRKRKVKSQLPFSFIVYDQAPTRDEVSKVKRLVTAGMTPPYVLERDSAGPEVAAQPDVVPFSKSSVGMEGYLESGEHVVVIEVLVAEKQVMVQPAGDDNPKHAIYAGFSDKLYKNKPARGTTRKTAV